MKEGEPPPCDAIVAGDVIGALAKAAQRGKTRSASMAQLLLHHGPCSLRASTCVPDLR
ncbi:hypothetical protein BH09MYX1_BH09MYX1_23580 [soil metagenome]